MAGDGKSTLQSILENVRDAGVAFGRRFAPPADIRTALKKLLAELGIAEPDTPVLNALGAAAAAWRELANSLSGVRVRSAPPLPLFGALICSSRPLRSS